MDGVSTHLCLLVAYLSIGGCASTVWNDLYGKTNNTVQDHQQILEGANKEKSVSNQGISIECHSHDECPVDKACVYSKCVDPCKDRCAKNAKCSVYNHLPNCICNPGFTGNALDKCDRPQCVTIKHCPAGKTCVDSNCVDPCKESCADNAECKVHQNIPNCVCKPGYTGDPLVNCEPGHHKSYLISISSEYNYTKADEFCKNAGMTLATFDNEAEFNQLANLIKQNHTPTCGFWVAGSDLAERDVWRWHTTGRKMAYLPWYEDQPDHSKRFVEEERCVEVHFYSDGAVNINDDICSFGHRVVCEI